MKNIALYFVLVVFFACSESLEVKRQQLFLKGNIALEEGKFDQSLYYYNQSLELSDTFPSVYNNAAIAYEKLGKNEEAFESYEKALSVDPEFWRAYFNRARLWQQIGNYRNALSNLEMIEKPYADSSSFYFIKGLSHTGLSNYDLAEKAFLKAQNLNQENVEIPINLATLHYYQKQYDQAMSYINDIGNVDDHPQALNLLGLIYTEKEDYDKATQSFTKAIQTSSDPYYYNNRGYAYLLSGSLEKGMDDIKYSLLENDENPWAFRNKGIYHYLKDEWDQSEQSLRKSYMMDSTVNLTTYYLGMVKYKSGDKSEACELLYKSSVNNEKQGQQAYGSLCR